WPDGTPPAPAGPTRTKAGAGAHAERRATAGLVWKASRAGRAAMRLATRIVTGAARTTAVIGVTEPGATPSCPANTRQAQFPDAIPTGRPKSSATAAVVVACQAVTADSWARTKPRVSSTARSR